MARPEELKYTATHEWARIEGDLVTVGITDYAVEQLSDLAFVDLPEVGNTVQKGSRFGEIESTKTVADLIAPVSGEIIEVNSEVTDKLQLLSHSPFQEGWLIKIRASRPEEAVGLMDAKEYQTKVESEEH